MKSSGEKSDYYKRELQSEAGVYSSFRTGISHQNSNDTTHNHSPPDPFLLPHKALETCEVMNYTIPLAELLFVGYVFIIYTISGVKK